MSRNTGLLCQNLGMLLIVTVMLLDKFIFPLDQDYVLVCALVAAVLLAAGVRTVARYDEAPGKPSLFAKTN